MKKFFAIQVSALILVSSLLGGMLVFTDVYEEVHTNIVLVPCLACLKLDPKTETDFTFQTANSEPNPDFVLDNLTKGVVFLHYSMDACPACDIMKSVIEQLFDIEFEKDEMFNETISYDNSNVSFIYTNIQYASEERINSIPVYDKEHIGGLPMFMIVTLGNDSGTIKPYFVTLYGTLNLDNDQDRMALLNELMKESIEFHNQNSEDTTTKNCDQTF